MEKEVIDRFEDIGKKLNEEYLKAGNKSKQKRIIYDLYTFDSICEESFNFKNKHLWIVDSGLTPKEDKFIEYINRDKKIFFDISKSVVNCFANENYSYNEYRKVSPKLSKKEMMDIVFSFLNTIDVNIYNKLKEKIDNYSIFETSLYGYQGFIVTIEILKDNFIVVNNESGYNLEFALSLVHETGHLFELEHLYSQNRSSYRSMSMLTPYYEVSSSFFEYAFLRYLNDNRIIDYCSRLQLHNYFIDLFINNFYMNLICMKKDIIPNGNYVYIDEENTNKYAEYIMNKTNFYGISFYNEGLDYRDSFIYSIGQLFAVYMYERYKEDKNSFINEFKRSFLLYPDNPCIDVFSGVGIDYDIIKEGKILRKIIKNS